MRTMYVGGGIAGVAAAGLVTALLVGGASAAIPTPPQTAGSGNCAYPSTQAQNALTSVNYTNSDKRFTAKGTYAHNDCTVSNGAVTLYYKLKSASESAYTQIATGTVSNGAYTVVTPATNKAPLDLASGTYSFKTLVDYVVSGAKDASK